MKIAWIKAEMFGRKMKIKFATRPLNPGEEPFYYLSQSLSFQTTFLKKCAVYEGLVNACSLSFASVVCCIVRVFVTSHDYAWGHDILQQVIKAILQLLFK